MNTIIMSVKKLVFDICSDSRTLNGYFKGIIHDESFDTIFFNMYDTITYPVTIIDRDCDNNSYFSVADVKNGDIVDVLYFPMSQKYIDYYDSQRIIGKIFYIDIMNDDALLYFDTYDSSNDSIQRTIRSVTRDNCSYYGDTRGYGYYLTIVE